MRPKPPPDELRPVPAHDGPFVPAPDPGEPATPVEESASAGPEALPTVEELAERHGLGDRKSRFVRSVLWGLEGYGQGQRVSPEAFAEALERAKTLPLDGSPPKVFAAAPDPARARVAAQGRRR